MKANRPLTGCRLTGSLQNPAADFNAVASSLHYQSNTLGIETDSNENNQTNESFAFEFETPYTTPVIGKVTRWGDNFKQIAATENIIQAACGLMSVHGRVSGKPQSLGLNYVSTLTASLALQGCVATALGQLRGHSITHSKVTMSSAALLSVGQYLAGATTKESAESLLPGHISHPAAPPFVSSDGVIFELETLSAEPWQKFWSQFGINSSLAGNGWTAFLLRYAKAISPVPDDLIQAISKHTYQHIVEICAKTGMSICRVRTINERAQDENFAYEYLQGPWAFNFGPKVLRNPFPAFDNNSLPLSGFTVIESCRRIQGPLAGHLLALLGAKVIRLEPPGGDPLRGMPPIAEGCSTRFDALNRLKTIQEVDIKSLEGKNKVKELIRHADVFLHNWAPNKATQLGLDYSDFVSINPCLVYAYAGSWSLNDEIPGDLESIPGTDFMTQAHSGIAEKISKNTGTNGGSLFTILDVLGGVISAQGITVALLNRYINNVGAKVNSSLMSAATLLNVDDIQEVLSALNHYQKVSLMRSLIPNKKKSLLSAKTMILQHDYSERWVL